MTKWERNCSVSPGRWRRVSQKPYVHWILIVVVLALLLFWDAGFYQGCWKESSCGVLPSRQVAKPSVIEGLRQRTKSSIRKSQVEDNHLLSKLHGLSERKAICKDLFKTGLGVDQSPVVEAVVAFNKSLLLLLNSPIAGLRDVFNRQSDQLKCIFARGEQTNVFHVEDGAVHCSHPENAVQKSVLGSVVTLECDGSSLQTRAVYEKAWGKKLVYGFTRLEDGDVLLFVKGLARSKRSLSPEGLECQYGDTVRTKVVTFCQENVRCKVPPQRIQKELNGKHVTLFLRNEAFPSVVRLPDEILSTPYLSVMTDDQKPYFLCACTLVWNGAKFLKEWIMYHSYLGVERFFFYDNNSDDDKADVLETLRSYNVSRHPWPWLKTQEASFSHCAVRASKQCVWVAFIDLDEFIFPKSFLPAEKNGAVRGPLHCLVKEYDRKNRGKLGQLKISNFNFGPSGLKTLPKSGQMVNYVCRTKLPRRVKSIVRALAIHPSYCSRVHYFELKAGYRAALAVRKDAIIHHYKYHVWEDFKLKFVRRAATFVTDWEQNKDLYSFDRTPGLGTQAIEPPDWAHQFCDLKDTSLRDFVCNNSHLYVAGKLVWE